MSKGQSQSTGPNQGIGAGERDRGTPEDVTFKKERIPAKGLDPRGVPVSTFTVDGPALTGEATIEKGVVVVEAARQHAKEVETEPLPVEVREQVLRFNDLLLGGQPGAGGSPVERGAGSPPTQE